MEKRFRAWLPSGLYGHEEALRLMYNNASSVELFHNNAVIMQYSGLEDTDKQEAWEGDLREYKGKIYVLVNDGWQWRLERNMYRFGDNDSVLVDEDVIFESQLRGVLYTHPNYIRGGLLLKEDDTTNG